jgi:hypothetical protein
MASTSAIVRYTNVPGRSRGGGGDLPAAIDSGDRLPTDECDSGVGGDFGADEVEVGRLGSLEQPRQVHTVVGAVRLLAHHCQVVAPGRAPADQGFHQFVADHPVADDEEAGARRGGGQAGKSAGTAVPRRARARTYTT